MSITVDPATLPPKTSFRRGRRGWSILGLGLVSWSIGWGWTVIHVATADEPRPNALLLLSLLSSSFLPNVAWIVGLLCVVYAITDLRRQTATLLEQTHQLHAQNEALARAAAQAQAANADKSVMLATVSHELRTPLTVVLSTLQLLEMGLFGHMTKEQMEALTQAEGASKQLHAIINDALDWSKLGAERLPLHLEPTHLPGVLDEVVTAIRGMAARKGLKVELAITPRMETSVVTDCVRLRQIVFNLLSNAVKFTDQGKIIVEAMPMNAGYYAIQVCDTGVGIPRDKWQSVWEPFVQADSSRSQEQGGTGLGLAIVHGLVKLLGGSVSLESQVGVGSTFTVVLPYNP